MEPVFAIKARHSQRLPRGAKSNRNLSVGAVVRSHAMERSDTLFPSRLRALGRLPATTWVLAFGWILLFGSYAIASLTLSRGRALTAFGDIGMCLVSLYAAVCLLLNISSS